MLKYDASSCITLFCILIRFQSVDEASGAQWRAALPQTDAQTHQDFFQSLVRDLEESQNQTAVSGNEGGATTGAVSSKWKNPDSSKRDMPRSGKHVTVVDELHGDPVENVEAGHSHNHGHNHEVHLPHSHLEALANSAPLLNEQIRTYRRVCCGFIC